MEKFIYYNSLFDCYSALLTDKECQTFKEYYQEDFSLSEIADEKNVSRSAVQKTIKNVISKLEQYENILKQKTIYDTLQEIENSNDLIYIHGKIKEILNK